MSDYASEKSRHEMFMREALLQASKALDEGEVPVGCVFVDASSNTIISKGSNKTNETRNVRKL